MTERPLDYMTEEILKPENVPVVILAGGQGHRLSAITHNTMPKALVEITPGNNFIDQLLNGLEHVGFGSFYFCLGFQAGQIINHLERRKTYQKYLYIVEEPLLGTAGAIEHTIKEYFITSPFLLTTGDAIYPYLSIPELLEQYRPGQIIWAATSVFPDCMAEYHSLLVSCDKSAVVGNTKTAWLSEERFKAITEYAETIVLMDSGHGIIDPFVFLQALKQFLILRRRIKSPDDQSPVCFFKDILPMLAEQGRRRLSSRRTKEPILYAHNQQQPTLDMGTPERLTYAQGLSI